MNRPLSARDHGVDNVQGKVPTADGTRVELDEINVGTPDQAKGVTAGNWFHRTRSILSLFLAGMYTGIGCSGVPHSHHTYGHDRDKGPI